MWAKIITIKRTKDLNYFSLCALHLFNTQVSQFELNYWNKWTFPRHHTLLRCTCIVICLTMYLSITYDCSKLMWQDISDLFNITVLCPFLTPNQTITPSLKLLPDCLIITPPLAPNPKPTNTRRVIIWRGAEFGTTLWHNLEHFKQIM